MLLVSAENLWPDTSLLLPHRPIVPTPRQPGNKLTGLKADVL
jgi:hypothetical protein